MKILRIPNRYNKQLLRLKNDERLFIFDSLMKLSCGENLKLPDTMAGDILELIWRDCVQMEKKNGNFDENLVGNLLASNPAGNSAGNSAPEMKGSEVKGKEVYVHFEKFWEIYPRKENKKKAMEKWKKMKVTEELFETIEKSIKSHKETKQWKDYIIPHATTWLNQERWEDEVKVNTEEEFSLPRL